MRKREKVVIERDNIDIDKTLFFSNQRHQIHIEYSITEGSIFLINWHRIINGRISVFISINNESRTLNVENIESYDEGEGCRKEKIKTKKIEQKYIPNKLLWQQIGWTFRSEKIIIPLKPSFHLLLCTHLELNF